MWTVVRKLQVAFTNHTCLYYSHMAPSNHEQVQALLNQAACTKVEAPSRVELLSASVLDSTLTSGLLHHCLDRARFVPPALHKLFYYEVMARRCTH